ncbi:uncharacterized protein K02A2.6-like [Ischnura elegans]|uniref:uncharacterized protein K02A2.6-like n=1 Tax=Ischnura elegans TaxID=197161 RepID=UPI001ED8BC8D|nr:uncharacterized protein K02A2.6-like [Ischnura elegans]
MLRWALLLKGYDFHIKYRPGKNHANADFFSRFPVDVDEEVSCETVFPDPAGVLLLEEAPAGSPLTAQAIADATSEDKTLREVREGLLHGWKSLHSSPEAKVFFSESEGTFTVLQGYIQRGSRVVIPPKLRPSELQLLQKIHQGVVRTKALARSYVWWPKLDMEIEEWVLSCPSCCETRPNPKQAPVIPWNVPQKPWSRLHLDYAGPIHGYTFLILIDAFSKWVEVEETRGSVTTQTTVNCLRKWFSTHGIPDHIVTDNGPSFTSDEFRQFVVANGIAHIRTAPYNPALNGQAERTAQTVKNCLKKLPPADWRRELANILLILHTTPSTVTGRTPSEMMMGRKIQTMLDKLHPLACPEPPRREQETMDLMNDGSKNFRFFSEGDPVYYRNYCVGKRWLPGVVQKVMGLHSYLIISGEGKLEKRHINQLFFWRGSHGSQPQNSESEMTTISSPTSMQ